MSEESMSGIEEGISLQVSRENAIIGGLIIGVMTVGVLGMVTVHVGEATGLLTLGGDHPADVSEALMDVDDVGDRPVIGDADAPVTIVAYEDFFCQFCTQFNQEIFPEIKEDYIDEGKVRYVFRHFVAAGGGNPAIAAECVREQEEDMFWEFHEMHYHDGPSELGPEDREVYEQGMVQWVDDQGLDAERFETCYEEEEPRDWVESETATARALGAGGTPTTVINGEVIQGVEPYNVYRDIIENELDG